MHISHRERGFDIIKETWKGWQGVKSSLNYIPHQAFRYIATRQKRFVRTGRDEVQGSGHTETFHRKCDWKWRRHRHFYDGVKQSDSLSFFFSFQFSMQANKQFASVQYCSHDRGLELGLLVPKGLNCWLGE